MVETLSVWASIICISIGVVFFGAGTTGMLRFPDVYTRLHAMTKADNLGLGFVALGLLPLAPSWSDALKLVLIWGFILMAGTTAAHLVAQSARRHGRQEKLQGEEM